jgi:hypothetical protein
MDPGGPMHDKSFQQAIQDLQDRLLNGFQSTIFHMIGHRTTVAAAASDIQDERVRTIVTKTLIVEQITMLLALMKGMQFINEAQYNEFVDYLTQSPTYQPYSNSLSREQDTV